MRMTLATLPAWEESDTWIAGRREPATATRSRLSEDSLLVLHGADDIALGVLEHDQLAHGLDQERLHRDLATVRLDLVGDGPDVLDREGALEAAPPVPVTGSRRSWSAPWIPLGLVTAFLLDQLARSPQAPLEIKLPSDARARRVAEIVQAAPSLTTPISGLARGSGASVRTIERLFLRETGMTFGRWRQRIRVLSALRRLAAGESVTAAGLAVGYDSTSAFIAMFKRVLGTTPGSYF